MSFYPSDIYRKCPNFRRKMGYLGLHMNPRSALVENINQPRPQGVSLSTQRIFRRSPNFRRKMSWVSHEPEVNNLVLSGSAFLYCVVTWRHRVYRKLPFHSKDKDRSRIPADLRGGYSNQTILKLNISVSRGNSGGRPCTKGKSCSKCSSKKGWCKNNLCGKLHPDWWKT